MKLLYQTGQHNRALKTLDKASQYAKTRTQAQGWMQRIKTELQTNQQVSSRRGTSAD